MSSLIRYKSLKNSKQFSYFYNNSKRQHISSAIVFYKKSEQSQVGFTASKKIGNAVKRNFAKRRLRALFIAYQSQLSTGTYIFVAKKDILDLDFIKLKKDLRYAFKRVGAFKRA
ncbi:MAG: ribonuclease P protein component [Epsilonproteobacteria bacterium]|nr:ribonuclease P protein component [Campylobacterota bacterium]